MNKAPDGGLAVPGDTPRPVIEMIAAILENQDMMVPFEGRRGTVYIDYAPGNVKIRTEKLGSERESRVSLGT